MSGYPFDLGDLPSGEALIVEWVERQPRAGTASAAVVTTPYAVAGVPIFAGEVHFEKLAAVPE